MGALTTPVYVGGTRVVSGDVVWFRPRGMMASFRRAFLGVVDTRDCSIPYLVRRKRGRVWRIPLEGASCVESGYELRVYRLPGIDWTRASTVAARAAERPGEGVHHPDYDCGRSVVTDRDLIADAYRAIDVDIDWPDSLPGPPLVPVCGPQDPPNEIIHSSAPPPVDRGGASWIRRGIRKTLSWQLRSRR